MAVLVFFAILGRISTIAVAAGNVVFRIAALSFMPGIGVGIAVQTLVGLSLGAGDVRGAVRAGWGGVSLSVLLMGAFSVLFLLVPEWLMSLFTRDPDLIRAGTPILRMMGLVQIFDAVGLTLAGALKGAGETRVVMIVDVVTAWLLFLPAAWFFGIHLDLGLTGAWIGVLVWFFVYAVGITAWFMRGDWHRRTL
jgi:Na+-driven multidrug efflux pump